MQIFIQKQIRSLRCVLADVLLAKKILDLALQSLVRCEQ